MRRWVRSVSLALMLAIVPLVGSGTPAQALTCKGPQPITKLGFRIVPSTQGAAGGYFVVGNAKVTCDTGVKKIQMRAVMYRLNQRTNQWEVAENAGHPAVSDSECKAGPSIGYPKRCTDAVVAYEPCVGPDGQCANARWKVLVAATVTTKTGEVIEYPFRQVGTSAQGPTQC